MKLINIRFAFFLLLAAVSFTACKKTEVTKPLGDRGQTIVKFMPSTQNGGYNYYLSNFQVVSTPQVLDVVEIRRDVPNESELNKTLSVIVKEDPAAITTYNAANGTALIQLPSSAYTIDGANPRNANGEYTVTFNPGEFAKNLKINLTNAASLDLTKQYAIGLTMNVAVQGADGKVSFDNRTVVVELGPLNRWDGIYKVTGAALRAGDAVLSGDIGPVEIPLVTTASNAVSWSAGVPWANGSGSQLPGGYEPILTFDPATNVITSVSSSNGAIMKTNPVVRRDILNAGTLPDAVVHRYDPATKTIYFEFTYGAGPSSRLFSFKAQYVRPR